MFIVNFIFNVISASIFGIYTIVRDLISVAILINQDIEEATDTTTNTHKSFMDRVNESKEETK